MKSKTYYSDAHYRLPIGRLKIEINVGGQRDLTEDEEYFVNQKIQEISQLIADNTIINDPEHISSVKQERQDILDCFSGRLIYVKEIPNGYSKGLLKPWFEVTTPKGIIEIGWRKRVICISWDKSDIEAKSETLFLNEETTKFDNTVHAWGYEKATEYITKLLAS